MYTDDIRALLTHSAEDIETLRKQSQNGSVHPVRVKSILENLRSALDYAAVDIARRIALRKPGSTIPKAFFPYGTKQNQFKIGIAKSLPLLKETFPKVFNIIEAAQPFKSNDGWLVELCNLTNDVKHNRLAKSENVPWPTIKQPQAGVFISGPETVMRNNFSDTGPLDDVHANIDGTVTVSGNSGQTWVTVEDKIFFQGRKIEVLPFLKKCTSNLVKLTTEIGDALESE